MSKKKKENPVTPESAPADGNVKESPAQPDTLPADALADGFLDSSSMPGTQRKNWFLTINNPLDHDPPFTHEHIKKVLTTVFETPVVYFCMANEVGLEKHTPHTHILVCFEKVVRFRTVCDAFDQKANIGVARSIRHCIDYIQKSGKWLNNPKADTRVDMDFNTTGESSFEEWGERPPDTKGKRLDYAEAYDDLVAGKSVPEILAKNKDFLLHVDQLQKARLNIQTALAKSTDRDVCAVFFECAFLNRRESDFLIDFLRLLHDNSLYLVSDTRDPWGSYDQQDAIAFLYFDGTFRPAEMLRVLDGHNHELPARFTNRPAFFRYAYIIAMESLLDVYGGISSAALRTLSSRLDAFFSYKGGRFTLQKPTPQDLNPCLRFFLPPPKPEPPASAADMEEMFGGVTEVTQ